MTWRYDRSEERVKAHLKNMGESRSSHSSARWTWRT
jgi:hypothetical protein